MGIDDGMVLGTELGCDVGDVVGWVEGIMLALGWADGIDVGIGDGSGHPYTRTWPELAPLGPWWCVAPTARVVPSPLI